MKVTLGLNSNHADSSAAIFLNNELTYAIEEERINRIKHWSGLPIESINACLNFTNKSIEDIDYITINTNPRSNIHRKGFFFIKNFLFGKKKYEIFKRLEKKINLKKNIEEKIKIKFNTSTRVNYIDHHLSHLASAFYPSGYKKAVGLSIDGFGDFCSIAIAKCDFKNIEIIKKTLFPNSLGLLYEAFTQLIGFKKYGEEYKMMGLSCYGKPVYFDLIKKNLFKNYENNQLNLNFFKHTDKNFTYNFEGEPNQNIIFNEKINNLTNDFLNINDETKKNIASSIQKIFEDKLIGIIKSCKELNFSDNLVYAGGCALNSLANKKLYESKIFKNIFIPYAPGDGGGSIGSALYFLKNHFSEFKNLQNPYLGNEDNNSEIDKYIKNNENLNNFHIEKFESKNEIHEKIATFLAQNKVIGFFNGKMEFGARALGNRSILANPCSDKMKDILNLKIKRRENFRPFAPSILLEHKREWFGNNIENPYMSNVEDILPEKRNLIPAVTHFDGTGRVQTVSKSINKDYHNLITKFYEKTRVPILLNTSFNENEPIVSNYKQAIDCFLRTKIDVLILNNFMILR